MTTLYEQAKAEFDKLPEVNDDELDGTIDHLVFRAQHEIDLVDEGEREHNGESVSKADYNKIKRFIKKWAGK